MPALADEIDDGPVVLSLLKVLQFQMDKFGAAETAAEEHPEDGAVTFTTRRLERRRLHQRAALFRRQPIADSHTKLFNALTRFIPAASSGLSNPESEAS